MTDFDGLIKKIMDPNTWYESLAFEAYANTWYYTIYDREGKEPYLTRFWVTPPRRVEIQDTSSPFESSNSVLLHYFHKGDDDDALHDHPWNFNTTILSGGYDEQLPPPMYNARNYFEDPLHGPEILSEYKFKRRTGDIIARKATDLHMVVNVRPDTWTLVTTGMYIRTWGFHPEGEAWVNWRDYLGIEA